MVIVETATRIAAPTDRVWAMFQSREGQLQLAAGFLTDLELIGEGLGGRRIMHLGGPWGSGRIEERITAYDEAIGLIEYAIVDTGGMVPFADYAGRIRVTPDGEGSSLVMLRSSFVPVDMAEAEARALSEGNIAMLIANLRAAFA